MKEPAKCTRIARSFIYCGISNALDGTEDNMIHDFNWYRQQIEFHHDDNPKPNEGPMEINYLKNNPNNLVSNKMVIEESKNSNEVEKFDSEKFHNDIMEEEDNDDFNFFAE